MIDCPVCDEWIATILATSAATPISRQCPDCGVLVRVLDETTAVADTDQPGHCDPTDRSRP